MKRIEVSDFIRQAVDKLEPATEYGRGRISEFSSDQNQHIPKVWQETQPVTVEVTALLLPVDSWNIILWIAQQDTEDSTATQYEAIIDTADEIAQKMIFLLNNFDDDDSNDLEITKTRVTITGITRTPFIKKTSLCLTGVMLEFTLESPDMTDLC